LWIVVLDPVFPSAARMASMDGRRPSGTSASRARFTSEKYTPARAICGPFVGADSILTHRADPNLTQGGALRFE
jgi:hypothetical protein